MREPVPDLRRSGRRRLRVTAAAALAAAVVPSARPAAAGVGVTGCFALNRFLIPDSPLLLGPLGEAGVIVLEGPRMSIATCAPVRITKAGGRHLRAVWRTCTGIAGGVRLRATVAPDCKTLVGTIVARKANVRERFSARLSYCGDGVLDPDGGEQCELGVACGPGTHCGIACHCLVDTAPTDTSTTTSTPIGSTTSTSTLRTATSTSTTSTSTTTSTILAGAVSFAVDVQPILTRKCALAACHGGAPPAQGLDLRTGASYAALVNVPSTECASTRLVVPGDPTTSYVVWKIQNSGPCLFGKRMPVTSALPAANVRTIVGWIAQGARDN